VFLESGKGSQGEGDSEGQLKSNVALQHTLPLHVFESTLEE
jgi:hypothetical protein